MSIRLLTGCADEPSTVAEGACSVCQTRVSGPLMDVARAQWEGKAYAYCARCGATVWLTVTAGKGGE